MTDLYVMPFLFEGDSLIRVVDRDGEPWFVAADICRVLGIKQPTRAVEPLDEDEKGVISVHTLGGLQDGLIVSESGLYTIILRSRAATTAGTPAHRFRKWVTSELLPTIRKTGKYERPGGARPAPIMDETLLSWRDKMSMVALFIRMGGPRAGAQKAIQLGFKSVPALDAILAQKQFEFVVDLDETPPSNDADVN